MDDIIQNVMDDNTANISFTVEHGELRRRRSQLEHEMFAIMQANTRV